MSNFSPNKPIGAHVRIIKPEADIWHDYMCAALAGMCSVWLTRRQTESEWLALSEDIDVVVDRSAEVADKALEQYQWRHDD